MNVLIFDISNTLGGAETFNCRLANYLIENGDNVAILGTQHSLVVQLLKDMGHEVKLYEVPKADKFIVGPRRELELKKLGCQIFDDFNHQDIYVLAAYFDIFHKAMHIFDGNPNIFLMSGILHPEAWTIWEPDIGFNANRAFGPKKINELWRYQGQLLEILDENNALWYSNSHEIFRKYNADYFSISLTEREGVPFPVEKPNYKIDYFFSTPVESLKIVWLGRFDFFKNQSLLKFIEEVNFVKKSMPQLHIQFDLIGHGAEKYLAEIRAFMEIANFSVNIIGQLSLTEVFQTIKSEQYDFGVAMGSSAFHLAYVGLPLVAIDSCVKGYRRLVKALWLDEASIEFDEGSSLYLSLLGESLPQRREIRELIYQVFDDGFLQTKSKHCFEYVDKNHNMDKVFPKFRKMLLGSTFNQKFVYESGGNLSDEFSEFVKGKAHVLIAVFGAGIAAQEFTDQLDLYRKTIREVVEIQTYFDNDKMNWGNCIYGVPIRAYSYEASIELDAVVIASQFWPEIKLQLLESGFNPQKIIRAF